LANDHLTEKEWQPMATKKKESAGAKEAAATGGGSTEDFEKLGLFYLG
jgi:hypothetical protein